VFCNRNAGHEKGSVESKVGYSRRNFLQLEETSGRMKDIWTPEAMRYTEQDLTEYDMLAEAGVGV
jgi:hypothetical protein